jgi:hypothetical protein
VSICRFTSFTINTLNLREYKYNFFTRARWQTFILRFLCVVDLCKYDDVLCCIMSNLLQYYTYDWVCYWCTWELSMHQCMHHWFGGRSTRSFAGPSFLSQTMTPAHHWRASAIWWMHGAGQGTRSWCTDPRYRSSQLYSIGILIWSRSRRQTRWLCMHSSPHAQPMRSILHASIDEKICFHINLQTVIISCAFSMQENC